MYKKLKIPEKEIKLQLLKNYGLTVTKIEKLHGFYDANFKVFTDNSQFFLKIYGVDKEEDVKFQCGLMALLNKNGLPVAKPFPAQGGKGYCFIKSKPAIIQNFFIGKHLDDSSISESLAFDIGKKLGLFHKSVKGKKLPGKNSKIYMWDLAQFNLIHKSWLKIKAKSKLLNKHAGLIDSVFADWTSSLPQLNKLNSGVIHNDFHGRNLLVNNNKVSGIVDFGDALYSWYLADVAIPIFHIFLEKKNSLSLIGGFIKGYKTQFDLPKKDWEMLALLGEMRAVAILVGVTLDFGEDGLLKKGFMNKTIEILKRFSKRANKDELVSIAIRS